MPLPLAGRRCQPKVGGSIRDSPCSLFLCAPLSLSRSQCQRDSRPVRTCRSALLVCVGVFVLVFCVVCFTKKKRKKKEKKKKGNPCVFLCVSRPGFYFSYGTLCQSAIRLGSPVTSQALHGWDLAIKPEKREKPKEKENKQESDCWKRFEKNPNPLFLGLL